MSELFAFIALGFRHITDPSALDHALFLVALAAIYTMRDWRSIVWVVSAFTVGHSVTLALAVADVFMMPSALIELLIPLTIVATCVENLVAVHRRRSGGRYRPVLAGVFGLVHGAGFANYLRGIFPDQVGLPLLGFNIGIELGQLFVLAVIFAVFLALDAALRRVPRLPVAPMAARGAAVSLAVLVVAAAWTFERIP